MKEYWIMVVIALLVGVPETNAASAALKATTVLKNLRSGHPRLLVLDSDLVRVKKRIETDATARKYRDQLVRDGEKLLEAPTVEYVLQGPRLLAQSRRCLDRIYTLATLYRLDGDRRWMERAKQELFAAAAFPDWNPSHFLDTAEMTHAFGIGYDWLYDALSTEERAALRKAMVEKGLRRGREAYEGTERWTWWTQSHHNWNQVCNGGMILGALAVADEEPELAAFIVTSALKSLPKAMASFAPDGGWAEGPGYWAYTVRYTVPLIAGLETALGSDFGLAATEGFDRTGTFHLYFVGPTGKSFNFADGSEGVGSNPTMRWLARRFQQPLYHWAAERSAGDGSAMDLLWYEPVEQGPKAAGAPLDMLFRGIDVAFLRSAWEDSDALYAGFKGGDNKANHSHLDLGTFVFDALGERWAVELGGDNYNLPAYFGNQRWTYYRLRTEGQNTLLLNDQNQDPKAEAPLVAFLSRPERAFAVADLTEGYAPLASRVRRGVALVDSRRSFLVQDEIEAPEPVAYRWLMHTRATVRVDGSTATLTQDGKTVRARVLEPAGALLVAASAAAPQPENPNEGITRLEVRLPDKVTAARIAVLLTPQTEGQRAADSVPITALEEWVREAGPLPAVGGALSVKKG